MPTREELRAKLHSLINGKSKLRGPRGNTLILKKDSDVLLAQKENYESFIKYKQLLEDAGYGVTNENNKRI